MSTENPRSKRKTFWSETLFTGKDVCLNCGKTIDYEVEIGFIATKEEFKLKELDLYEHTEKYVFCSECGTDVTRMYELGMKRIVGTVVDSEDDDLEDMLNGADEEYAT